LRDAGAKNTLFRVVPPQWGNDSAWVSPWALLLQGQGSPQGIAILTAWNDAAKAYRESDQAAFDAAMAEIAKASKDQTDRKRLAVELAYNQAQPFDAAQSLYIVALTLTVFGMLRPANIALRPLSLAAAGLGVTAHIAGIAMRIYILGRPPVGTLYESLLFVSVIVMLAALTIEAARKDRLALLAGCGVATFLLQLAPAVAPQGDSLHVLVAVLNTNFWLATHVVCITAGYGACVLAGSLAHVALYGGVRAADRLLPLLHKTLLAGLFLTAFGTVLGGIWADQSWGRFWGWDPKENGALLIVLWIAWLLHGRMAGFLKQPLYLALVCALNIVVALAWFGVNLLGVGLHSYGFITGIAAGLAAFCFVEIALIVLGAIRYQRA
jgi:ABC-type transport system involved in cytochrome c biogenesis permease subunit